MGVFYIFKRLRCCVRKRSIEIKIFIFHHIVVSAVSCVMYQGTRCVVENGNAEKCKVVMDGNIECFK